MIIQIGTVNSRKYIDIIFSRTLLVPPDVQEHEITILTPNLGDGENCMKAAIWGNQPVVMRKIESRGRSETSLKEVRDSIACAALENLEWSY